MRTTPTKSVLFTADEVADVLQVPRHWVKNRIQERVLVPAVRGSRGHRPNQFTLAQLLGAASVCWWMVDVGRDRPAVGPAAREVMRALYADKAGWTQEEAEQFLGLRRHDSDPWTAETLAKKLGPKVQPAAGESAADRKLWRKLAARLDRVFKAALVKLSEPDPLDILARMNLAVGKPAPKAAK